MRDTKEIISENLKRLMSEFDVKQIDLAKIAGVSESTAGKWVLQKAVPRMGAIEKIANHFNIPKSYIIEEQPTNLIPIPPNFVKIPILGEIACGEPILAEQNVETYTYELSDYLPVGNIFALIAKGDSMEPTIPNGCKVLIREQQDVENGEIAAVLVNGDTEATLKRIRKQGEVVILSPDNPNHQPIIVTESHPARIIGKAIRVIRDLI